MLKKALLTFTTLAMLSACSSMPQPDDEQSFPKTWKDRQRDEMGKLSGDEGIVLAGGSGKKNAATDGIVVNAYIWRAAIDYVHVLPVVSADPFGGTIITDWYRLDEKSNERFKVNVFIIGSELRSDALKVSAFTQTQVKSGQWSEPKNNPELANQIENTILLKARAIKYNTGK